MLGHSRISVTNPYYGSFGRKGSLDAPDRAAKNIRECFAIIGDHELKPIPKSRLGLCMRLSNELMAIDVFGDPRKVHMLWEDHSKRHAIDWLDLDLDKVSPIAILESTALLYMRRKEMGNSDSD